MPEAGAGRPPAADRAAATVALDPRPRALPSAWTPWPHQRAALARDAGVDLVVGGIGAGKSQAGAAKLLRWARAPLVKIDEAMHGAAFASSVRRALAGTGVRVEGYRTDSSRRKAQAIECGAPVVLCAADEVRCVLRAGVEPDARGLVAAHRFVSPAFAGAELDREALAWCVRWVLEHPTWRLSVQQHKAWGVR